MKKELLTLVFLLEFSTMDGNTLLKNSAPEYTNNCETAQVEQSSTRKTRMVGGNDGIYGGDNDGYVWYLVSQTNQDYLSGVEDIEGRLIIPIMYDHIFYRFNGDFDAHYFIAKKGDFVAAYTREGTLVIPLEKHYTNIFAWSKNGKIGWKCNKNGNKSDYLDAKGKKINIPLDIKFEFSPGNHFSEWNEKAQGYKIYDLDGNKWCEHGYVDDNCRLHYEVNGEWYEKPFVPGGEQYVFEPYEDLCYKCDYTSATIRQETKTEMPAASKQEIQIPKKQEEEKKIIIEHKLDPVPQPVQEWQACLACGGMGTMGCDNCGGSGTKYIGDRLHRCSRCNGRGIIPCKSCFGNKGQYITVYR